MSDPVTPPEAGELLRALAHLAEPPGPAHPTLAEALGLPAPPDAATHTDLFGFQLYPYASVYLGSEGMIGGEAEERISGFWRAVGREVPPEPDHLASLMGLYAALGEEEAELAAEPGAEARVTLVARSRRALLEEHLAPWVFAFLERIEELGGTFHARWAEMLRGCLLHELARGGAIASRPVHLEVAPPLPDPRDEGAAPFMTALLAPVRSGVILTRADLARIARALELGLRAGERRYALKHLMGQAAPDVLAALAEEAERQADLHAARSAPIGAPASFLEARARGTAELLRTLAGAARASELAESDGTAGETTPATLESRGS
ncbi:MAG: molecular chaperone TorD family protein [Gemmatimonadota bacterium]|nr:molecular chaperone TorD family protein [Gemmatimonadota bacterium]